MKRLCMGRSLKDSRHPGAICEECSRLVRSPEQEEAAILDPATLWQKNKKCTQFLALRKKEGSDAVVD